MGNVFKGTPTRHSVTNYGCISSRECPTCRGSGVIDDEVGTSNGGEYIALIPLTDQRLRPQRITIKIFVTILLCLAISGLLIFFLLLRSVHLVSNDHLLLPEKVTITETTVWLNLSYPINVTNWNFVPLRVESVELMAFYHAYVLNQTEATFNEWIPARSTKEIHINQTLVFDGPTFSVYLPKMCQTNNTYYNQIYITFRSNVKMSTLGQHFESVLDAFQLVSCYSPNPQH
ncbi:unnamed protein product [Rodentolepis nana]|uniref:Transmembrane protein 106A n=1 Tax=Rodentolepis nana TaxID=102285 RepID=A0A0R3TSE5_RODNA|nr:unnamed protein product [Rodentolepis nana]